MIRRELQNTSVETYGKKEESATQARISNANMSFILQLLSSIYKDPKGSIVRELTSNCFDAHKAGGVVDKSVVVSMVNAYDSEGYISFRDFGKGMTEEFMRESYMSYGTSTKRESEDEFGYFGIGSKSPLSIRDHYTLITYIDGTKYEYLIYQAENKIPELDLVNITETEEINGTEVRVKIDGEVYQWENAIKKQLKYFKDVYFIGNNIEHFNGYKIVEGEHFRFNDHLSFSNTYADISFDRVKYNIDYTQLNLQHLNLDIGIKFGINDLVPVPSREDVEYDDESIILIKERIKAALLEILTFIKSKYNEQPKTVEKYKKSKNKKIVVGRFEYRSIVSYIKDNTLLTDEELEPYLIKIEFEGFKNIGITPRLKNFDDNLENLTAFLFKKISLLKKGKNLKASKYLDNYNLKHLLYDENENLKILTLKKDDKLDKVKNAYLNQALNDNILVIQLNRKINYRRKKDFIRLASACFKGLETQKQYLELLKLLVLDISSRFDRYSDFEVTQEFKDSLKTGVDKYDSEKIKLIWYRNYYNKTESTYYFTSKEIIDAAKRHKNKWKTIVIGTPDQRNELAYFCTQFNENNTRYKFFEMSKRNKEKMLELSEKNIMSLEMFVQKADAVKKLVTSIWLKKIKDVKFEYEIRLNNYLPDLHEKLYLLNKLIEDHKYNNYQYKHIKDNFNISVVENQLLELAGLLKLLDQDIVDLVEEIRVFQNENPLLPYLKYDTPREVLVKYFVNKKIKLDKKNYEIKEDYSKAEWKIWRSFIEQNQEKLLYLRSIGIVPDRDDKENNSYIKLIHIKHYNHGESEQNKQERRQESFKFDNEGDRSKLNGLPEYRLTKVA